MDPPSAPGSSTRSDARVNLKGYGSTYQLGRPRGPTALQLFFERQIVRYRLPFGRKDLPTFPIESLRPYREFPCLAVHRQQARIVLPEVRRQDGELSGFRQQVADPVKVWRLRKRQMGRRRGAQDPGT